MKMLIFLISRINDDIDSSREEVVFICDAGDDFSIH